MKNYKKTQKQLKRMKWMNYIELVGGALLLQPTLSIFGIKLSENTIQIVVIFIISFLVIDKGKELKDKFKTFISKEIKKVVRKEIKNVKKK